MFANFPVSMPLFSDVPWWEILIKSTLALVVTALVCELLRGRSAALRHRVWAYGLAASLAAPVFAVLAPSFTLPAPWNSLPTTVVTGEVEAVGNAAGNDASLANQPSGDATSVSGLGVAPSQWTPDTLMAEDSEGGAAAPRMLPAPPVWPRAMIIEAVILVWVLGTLLNAALFFASLAWQQFRLSRFCVVDDPEWTQAVAAAAESLQLERPIVTLESNLSCVPSVVGAFTPRLVIPCDWRNWSESRRRCILLHELAHVKRFDVSTQLLGRLAIVAYWFNPLVWFAVRQLRAERELASDDCVLLSGQSASEYAEQLLQTLKSYRSARPAMGVAMAHSARLDQRVLAILDTRRPRGPVGGRYARAMSAAVLLGCTFLGGVSFSSHAAEADPAAEPEAAAEEKVGADVWKENYAVQYPGSLPVSVAFSADGELMLTGDTNGEVMALVFGKDEPHWRWKANVKGTHAAVAFSANQKHIYVTTADGVRILDMKGKEVALLEEKDSNPTTLGVFPDKNIADQYTRRQVVYGTPRGYFIKSWANDKVPDMVGTISTSTVKEGVKPSDVSAAPLAVDPKGGSAIVTGPIDPTGDAGGVKGKNVLWAYVCGDYDEGSPGNRVMPGHEATVVSAAWAKEGGTAVTGDASGRVILWDAVNMKESARLEFGSRVAALAISDDGLRIAAYIVGQQGKVFVWDTGRREPPEEPIHTEIADLGSTTVYASLSFSPDGKRLAGCVADKRWLNRLGELIGKVRVWHLSPAPKDQVAPKQAYAKPLQPGSSTQVVVLNNHTMLTPAKKQGAVDLRNVADGGIMVRLTLGKFNIGNIRLASDRRWLAIEQHTPPPPPNILLAPRLDFEVGIWDTRAYKQTAVIPSCRQLLDVASGGKVVAVVRTGRIELWDTATPKLLKSAPFEHKRIDAASFSPDGKLLAVSDQNELVLWRWADDSHERIKLGRTVGTLSFSPDGRFLAEGPSPRQNLQIRRVDNRDIVQKLANNARRSMDVSGMAYAQSGRVLIACDDITFSKEIAVPHRIHLWDVATGGLAHQLVVPSGVPRAIDVSPNGRHLVATVEDKDGLKVMGWSLVGQPRPPRTKPLPPASEAPATDAP